MRVCPSVRPSRVFFNEPIMEENGRKWLGKRSKCSKLVVKSSKLSHNVPNCPKMSKNVPKCPKMSTSDASLSESVLICSVLYHSYLFCPWTCQCPWLVNVHDLFFSFSNLYHCLRPCPWLLFCSFEFHSVLTSFLLASFVLFNFVQFCSVQFIICSVLIFSVQFYLSWAPPSNLLASPEIGSKRRFRSGATKCWDQSRSQTRHHLPLYHLITR